MSFSTLGLSPKVIEAVAAAGYTVPTAIQAEAIPHALARRDVLGLAQTGSGKTAAFVLPMLTLLEKGRARARMPRTLILEPTRELAMQVQEAFESLGRMHSLSVATLIGGVAFEPQAAKIDRGADVVIATPGRLLDHFERGKLLLTGVELLVIDEADRMLDMGFIPDIERICKLLPFTRQTLFFSATMPPEIQRLTAQFLHNPVQVETSRVSSTASTISQFAVKAPSDPKAKRDALRALIRTQSEIKNAIVFANRKTTVAVLEKSLRKHGFNAAALHGDMDQTSRLRTLAAFRAQEVTFLIASDVAARGLDIPEVSHVFNFDVPIHSEDYVHRIGRTGRAGREGHAYMLVTSHDTKHFKAIEELIKKSLDWFDIGKSFDDSNEGEAEERGQERGGRDRRGGRHHREGSRSRSEHRSERRPEKAAAPTASPETSSQGEQPVKQERNREPREARPDQPQAPRHRPRQDQPRAAGRTEGRRENRADKGEEGPDYRGFDQGNMPAFLTRTTRV
ncbi:MAG: DEAD/DEAH box helicase [Rhizobiales bacterium]|nr:DEAD/DEAH box helicase [Hyphomicrobiales bacterium]